MAGVSAVEDMNKTDDLGLSLDSNLDDSPEIFNAIDNGMNLKENSNSNENLGSDSNILSVSNEDVLAGNTITPANFTFAAIQTAVDSASDGDTISLQEGTYLNNGNGEININKSISIVGINGLSILDAQKTSLIFNITNSINNITDIVFMNSVDDDYGAIYFNNANGNVINCAFKDNTGGYGSGIFFQGNGGVINCTFTENKGSAIYFHSGENTAINCTFTENEGSGIWFYGNKCDVINCTFADNSARYGGGAVHWKYGDGNVVNCTFANNTVEEEDGGALFFEYVQNGVANVVNCTFTNNTVKENYRCGGAVYSIYSNVTVNNCALINNTASEGSEIYIEDSNLNLNNNWWGSNNPDWNKLIGEYVPGVYAVLNLTANPLEISYDKISEITTKFVWNGTNTDATNLLPKRNVKLSSNGNLTETEVDVGLISEFSAFIKDIYYVNATVDNEMLGVNVKVNSSKPITTNITVKHTSLDLTVGEIGFIIAELNPPEAGSLKCDYDDKIIDIKTNPDGSLTVTALAEGNTNITFSFPGNTHYAPAENKTVSVTVSLNDAGVIGEDMALNVGEMGAIKYSTDPEGLKVVFVADDSGVVSVDEHGIVTALKGGSANVTITVGDNRKYVLNSTTVTVSVSLNDAGVSGEDMSLNVGEIGAIKYFTDPEGLKVAFIADDSGVVSVDEHGIVTALKEGIANVTITVGDNRKYVLNFTTVTVTVSLNDANVSADDVALNVGEVGAIKYSTDPEGLKVSFVEDDSGVVSVDEHGIVTALKEGTAPIIVKVGGDGIYAENTTVVTVTVKKINLSINVSADEITRGENATINIELPIDATGNVTATIDGKTYTSQVNNGKANIIIPDLTSGNHTLPVTYSGDDKYNSAVTAVNITVNKNVTVVISAENLTKYYKDSEKFTVKVTDAEGEAASNKTVKITINGDTYKRTTDENGTASLNINLNVGIYPVRVVVDDVEANFTVTVKSTIDSSDIVKIFRNATQYNAIFTDVNGKPLSNIKVSFNLHGIIYNRTTDKNGAAKLNINLNDGEYILTAFNSATGEMKSNAVKVISLIESDDLTKYFRNASQFVVRIRSADGGYVGAGEEIKFNINGMIYSKKTNITGHAKLNINLGQGNYTITTYYKDCSRGNRIEVLPILSAEDLSMKYMDGSQFKAKLVDGKGNPYPNKNVTFNINGVFYNRVTDSDGVAKLNIRLMSGQYIITSSYNGCNIANKITISA